MHRVLCLLLKYFSLQEVTSQMYVDRKVASLLARECNEVFNFLDFKLSLCSVLTVSTFGCIPSVWFILADVSEPSVGSIFKGLKCER
jgi:hypothetical protein